jgi:hypothetical protein
MVDYQTTGAILDGFVKGPVSALPFIPRHCGVGQASLIFRDGTSMFAVMIMTDLLFARLCSLLRPASLDLRLLRKPSKWQLYRCSSIRKPLQHRLQPNFTRQGVS